MFRTTPSGSPPEGIFAQDLRGTSPRTDTYTAAPELSEHECSDGEKKKKESTGQSFLSQGNYYLTEYLFVHVPFQINTCIYNQTC